MRSNVFRARVLELVVLVVLLPLAFALITQTVRASPPAVAAQGTKTRTRQNSPALDNATSVIVALAPLSRTTTIELVALTLDVNLSETDGHTIANGTSTFKLHNTDVANPVSTTVGFPEWAGGALSFNPGQFSLFQVTTDNKKMLLTPTQAPVKIGKETRTVNWWAFSLNLDPDEKKVVQIDFAQDLGTGIFPRFTYGLMPSTGWKGSIGSARLSIHLPANTEGDQFIALDPTIPTFDGKDLTWLWTDLEPSADPGLTLIRFSLWQDLLNRRAAVAQTPDNTNAHTDLARIYEQLASIDSPRRDNFMSQAIAELETATRLDPKNVDAVSLLAQVYETRAGAPDGPRDANYVALALAEWQNLIGTRFDADARKHAAENSFYLGVAARTSGDNAGALKYFADAANFSPRGAGPFYTREHWQNETQAAHVALAQAAVQAHDAISALNHARAAYGNDFNLDPAPPLPAFALDHATVRTGNNQRQIVLHLEVYPGASDDAKQALTQIVSAMNQTNAATANLAAGEGDYTITLAIPFSGDQDLVNRMRLLSKTFPEREDWNIIRAVLDTPGIEWSESQDTLTRVVHYREEIDLADAPAPLRTNLNQVSQLIGQLEKAAPQDTRSQLRLALVRDAQQWWQRALATGLVSVEVDPTLAPAKNWTVKVGERNTLAYDDSRTRPEVYIAGTALGIFALALLGGLLLLIRHFWRR
ncbi:MAG: hypothetical protein WCF84_10725 [Anaerolineae bacterium]